MVKYILRRLVQAVPTFFGITLIAYFLMWASPGNVVDRLFFGPDIKPAARELLAIKLGINDPFHVQYLRWLLGDDWMRWDSDGDGVSDRSFIIPLDANGDGEPEPPGDNYGILRGDFGVSFVNRKASIQVVLDNLPATIELGTSALIVSLLFGVPIGVLSAVNRGRIFDSASRVMAVIFNAVPNFWLGLIMILIFGSALGLLPMGGRNPPSLTGEVQPLQERLNYLIMPTFVLAAANVALFSRFMRTSMLEVLGLDYVRTARAKGLSSRQVYFKHTMRNALIPIATLLGPILTALWSGAVVTETIFSWPGVGRTAFNSVIQKDFPVVMTVVIFAAIATILGYLLSDILYAVIDPRIRLD